MAIEIISMRTPRAGYQLLRLKAGESQSLPSILRNDFYRLRKKGNISLHAKGSDIFFGWRAFTLRLAPDGYTG